MWFVYVIQSHQKRYNKKGTKELDSTIGSVTNYVDVELFDDEEECESCKL